MSFGFMRCAKGKSAGSAGSADSHNERKRKTLNADEDKRDKNRTLINNAISYQQYVRAQTITHELSPTFHSPVRRVETSQPSTEQSESPSENYSSSARASFATCHAARRANAAARSRRKACRKADERRAAERQKLAAREREKQKKQDEQNKRDEQQKQEQQKQNENRRTQEKLTREQREQERREHWTREHAEREKRHGAEQRRAEAVYTDAEHAGVIAMSFKQPTPLHEQVKRMIDRAGGKPRKDSVEFVEFVFETSRAYFTEDADADGNPNQERLDGWVEANMRFMDDCTKQGLVFVKATLHLDEVTPHIHAIAVPLDPDDNLNCKFHFGGTRTRMSEWQTTYHKYVEPLGLERGVEGSRATYQELKDFYATLRDEVDLLDIDVSKIPAMPPANYVEASSEWFKLKCASLVGWQYQEKFETIRKQALLTNDEHRLRSQAERRAGSRRARRRAGGAGDRSGARRVCQ